ncbi:hypothetical protein ACFOWX_04815 [Sphingorhabdus arenilitoris]|uniref:Uncharacterized protein n=1 Tax=Sphingorhabdus arenilitoris TaxID=1490041 RepID=A0ABV8RET2_9SPHN
MLKPTLRVALSTPLIAIAMIGISGNATAAIGGQDSPEEPMAKDAPNSDSAVPAPTIDTNSDGKPDAWDRDGNGVPDAWDTNDDGKPDLVDNDGDGRPDNGEGPPPAEEAEQPQR